MPRYTFLRVFHYKQKSWFVQQYEMDIPLNQAVRISQLTLCLGLRIISLCLTFQTYQEIDFVDHQYQSRPVPASCFFISLRFEQAGDNNVGAVLLLFSPRDIAAMAIVTHHLFLVIEVIVFTEKCILTAIATLRDVVWIICGNCFCYTDYGNLLIASFILCQKITGMVSPEYSCVGF